MNVKKKKWWIIFLSALVIATSLLTWFYRTQTVWIESEQYQRKSNEPSEILVVVYSRTGNTFGAAQEIARYFDADVLKIEAPQYSRDLKGQLLASKHADEEITTTPIKHDPVDLKQYKLIFNTGYSNFNLIKIKNAIQLFCNLIS